jgi:hypothetical protein
MSRLCRAIACLGLAGLLTHCATPSGAGGAAASGGAGGLRFAWPEGFTAQVSATLTQALDDQPPETSAGVYTLRLEGRGEERRLITERVTADQTGAGFEEGPPPETPTLILGPTGELRRIEGIDKAIQDLSQEAEAQGIPPEQRELILGLVRDALEQSARSRWEALVGKWRGLVLKPGETVERKAQETVPLFGSTAATRERVSLKERVPCAEGEAERRCVRLVLESSLDPQGLARAKDALLQRVKTLQKANAGVPDSAIPERKVERLQLDGTLEFIAEPETLIPHHQRSVVTTHVVMQEEGGETRSFQIRNERVELFTLRPH